MKRLLTITGLILLAGITAAQTGEVRHDEFHSRTLHQLQRPMPYPHLREADVAWTTQLWKIIDCGEVFNLFFYFPDEENDISGKKSLAYILWDAMAAGEIPIYEDDELLIPLDNEEFVRRYTKPDTVILEIGYEDEDNDEHYEVRIEPKFFEGYEIIQYAIREAWFVGKADARQDSRRLALAPMKYEKIEWGSQRIEIDLGIRPIFWVPLMNPHVRNLLSRYPAYIDPNNIVNQPSWDWVFVSQYYNAFITRESNVHNRSLKDYVTGADALLEAAEIEAKVFEIENEMWEW